jgi:hypothetical protein
MDENKVFEMFLDISNRLAKIEEKVGRIEKLEERVNALEQIDAKKWRTTVAAFITSIAGAIVAFIVAIFGFKQ